MTYYFWLGFEAEKAVRDEQDALFFRQEILARQSECKPEADGFITIHPKLGR